MSTPTIRVFTRETVLRLGLQNRVVRKLRALGCKVRAVNLDSMLTIAVEPSDTQLLRRQRSGISMRRTARGHQMTIDMDGCCVVWHEPTK